MEKTKITPKTRKELANEYGVDAKTLKTWLKREGLDIPPGLICPKHLALIREKLGNPDKT